VACASARTIQEPKKPPLRASADDARDDEGVAEPHVQGDKCQRDCVSALWDVRVEYGGGGGGGSGGGGGGGGGGGRVGRVGRFPL
jgi:hypothetical protein